jgi:hypothetical protein
MNKTAMILDIVNNPTIGKHKKSISHLIVKSDYGTIESIYNDTHFTNDLQKLDFISFDINYDTGFIKSIEKIDKPKDVQYLISSDFQSQLFVNNIERYIMEGKDPSKTFKGITKLIKTLATEITLPTENHPIERFRLGKILYTYSSCHTFSGKDIPKLDVWTDTQGMITDENINSLTEDAKKDFLAAITIREGYVILSNGSIKYPKDWHNEALRGQEIKGVRHEDGTFTIDQENGKDTLKDEWLAPIDTVRGSYNIEPTEKTVIAYKAFPVFGFTPSNSFMQNQDGLVWEYGDKIKDTVCISVNAKNQIIGSSVVREQAFEESYMGWDTYWEQQHNNKVKVA